jgi:hypothetical protein
VKRRCFTLLNLIILLAPLWVGQVTHAATPSRPDPAYGQPTAPITAKTAPSGQGQATTSMPGTPVMFIENVGQLEKGARFQVRGADHVIWLAEDGIWVTVVENPDKGTRGQGDKGSRPSVLSSDHPTTTVTRRGVNLHLTFPGSNPHPRLEPFDRLDTHVSYFIGNDPATWHPDVPVWGGARYKDLYPGMDLEITGENGQMIQRLVCGSNCQFDLRRVRLRVEGADELAVAGNALQLSTAVGEFSLPLLQVTNVAVTDRPQPTITDDRILSPFANATGSARRTIRNPQSPVNGSDDLLYSTFLGGDRDDCPYKGCAIAVDEEGNAYVTGMTESWHFPTTEGAFDTSYPVLLEAFVVKVNPNGTDLVYATLLGGGRDDRGLAIAVDGTGCAYVAGVTESDNFPTTPGAYDESYNPGYYPDDGFMVKVNPDGTDLVYATYLGGNANDRIEGIALSGAGNAYVAGTTQSSNFPTTPGAFDPSYNSTGGVGELDAFVVKLNATGSGLGYSTYLGGLYDDGAEGIAVDGEGNAYVTGNTYSPDFPVTPGAYDEDHGGTSVAYVPSWTTDAFVAKLNAAGNGLDYATFLGGGQTDGGNAIAVDGANNAYVVGTTRSSDFPTTMGAFDTSFGGGTCGTSPCNDIFVVKLNVAGSDLAYSTFLGDDDSEYSGYSMAVDREGNAYVTGGTQYSKFPPNTGGFDTTFNGGWDAFVVKLNATGTELPYATFLGGSSTDFGYTVAVFEPDQAYVAGHTDSDNFPTTAGAFDTSYNGEYDVFVTKLATARYTISGQVLDQAGSLMAGVQISAGANYSATTNSSGEYTIADVPVGTYSLAPTTPGYLWSPTSRSVTVPPSATGQDFTAQAIQKQVTPGSPRAMNFGDPLTYTLRLIAPTDREVVLYDRVPTYTSYISNSVDAPAGVAYDLSANSISGTLNLVASAVVTVSFAVRVEVTGTTELAPLIVNRGCIYPAGGGLADCEWSNEVRSFTYVWPVYLPLIVRNH